MVETEVTVDNVNVQLPSGGDFTFVDSIRSILDDTVTKIRNLEDEALTGVFMAFMLALCVVSLWRSV